MREHADDLPADARTALARHGAVAVHPYGEQQRHRSYRVSTSTGREVWLKINVADDLASVEREAAVLESLTATPSVPRCLAVGRDGSWLLTSAVEGIELACLNPSDRAHALPAVAAWLRTFRSTAGPLPGFPAVPASDLFGSACDLPALLQPALAWWQEALNRSLPSRPFLEALRGTCPAGGPVHGSFDSQNILVTTDGRVGAVDLEAARPGLVSYDVASLLADLIKDDGALAVRWWEETLGDSDASSVVGHLLLRTWYRHCAGALDDGAVRTVCSFLSDIGFLDLSLGGRR